MFRVKRITKIEWSIKFWKHITNTRQFYLNLIMNDEYYYSDLETTMSTNLNVDTTDNGKIAILKTTFRYFKNIFIVSHF